MISKALPVPKKMPKHRNRLALQGKPGRTFAPKSIWYDKQTFAPGAVYTTHKSKLSRKDF